MNFSDPSGLEEKQCDPMTGEGCDGGFWGTLRVGVRDTGARQFWMSFILNSRFGGFDGGTSTRTPQNPVPPGEVDKLRTNLENLLKGKCGDFVAHVLNELEGTGTTPFSTNALKTFDEVRKQKGFTLESGALTAWGRAYGNVGSGNGRIGMRLSPPGSAHNEFITNAQIRALVHELMHVAPSSGSALYTHKQMAQAASSAAQALGYKFDRPLNVNFTDAQSSYFIESRLFAACGLRQ